MKKSKIITSIPAIFSDTYYINMVTYQTPMKLNNNYKVHHGNYLQYILIRRCLKKEEKDKVDEINKATKLLELAKEYKNTVKESDILENWKKTVCERYSLLPQKKKKICKTCKKIEETDKSKLLYTMK